MAVVTLQDPTLENVRCTFLHGRIEVVSDGRVAQIGPSVFDGTFPTKPPYGPSLGQETYTVRLPDLEVTLDHVEMLSISIGVFPGWIRQEWLGLLRSLRGLPEENVALIALGGTDYRAIVDVARILVYWRFHMANVRIPADSAMESALDHAFALWDKLSQGVPEPEIDAAVNAWAESL